MGRGDPGLQNNESDLNDKMINQFRIIKAHYFNITD